MKPDLYTKVALTVIAFMLVMIGCHQYVSPATTVKAEGPFANVQFNCDTRGDACFFDTRTGELFMYETYNTEPARYGRLDRKFRVTTLGQPMSVEYDVDASKRK
jgi:hypothetical protein